MSGSLSNSQTKSTELDAPTKGHDNSSPRSVFDMEESNSESLKTFKKESKWSTRLKQAFGKISKGNETNSTSKPQKTSRRSSSSELLVVPTLEKARLEVSSEFCLDKVKELERCPSTVTEESFSLEKLTEDSARLVLQLSNGTTAQKLETVNHVRNIARSCAQSRDILGESGAITPMLKFLSLSDTELLESSLLGLCNLAIGNKRNKLIMVEGGIIPSLVKLLESDASCVKEASTAVLLTLAADKEHKEAIGTSGAIELLVSLLKNGSDQGKADAAHALYNLAGLESNLQYIIQADAVPALLAKIRDFPATRAAEKAVGVISTLTVIEEGRITIADQGGVETLIHEIEVGSEKSKEIAIAALQVLCLNSRRSRLVAVECGAVSALLDVSQNSLPKPKARARALLKLLEKPGSAPMVLVSSSNPSDRSRTENNLVREMVRESMREAMHSLRKRANLLEEPTL